MGRWNWVFGPPPFGLHYAQYLFRDGFERGLERLRLMQPEAAGAVWDHTQTWRNALHEEDHPTTVGGRPRGRVVEPRRRAVLRLGELHRSASSDGIRPRPGAIGTRPRTLSEVLPEIHPDEFANKPALHKIMSDGLRGRPLEWANPGGATLTRGELARMTAGYYGMVAQLDHAVGRVLDALDERRLADDTLVIVTSDHGRVPR